MCLLLAAQQEIIAACAGSGWVWGFVRLAGTAQITMAAEIGLGLFAQVFQGFEVGG